MRSARCSITCSPAINPNVQPGENPGGFAIWQMVGAGPPPAISHEAREAPAELVAITERAMMRDVRTRYPDMSALAKDLTAYVEGRVVRAYETGAWAEARKWVLRNKSLATSLAAAVLAVVIGGVGFAIKADEATSAATLAQKNEQAAKDNLTLAQRNEVEAKAQQQRAEAETAKVLRLSDVKVLQELEAEADQLWPAQPDKIGELEYWVERARALLSNLAVHRATLTEMRAHARAWSDEERAQDRASHPQATELAEKQTELTGLIAHLEQGLSGDANSATEERAAKLELEVAAWTEAVESRQTWRFDTPEVQWQHDVLTELIRNLDELQSGLLAQDAIAAGHGWSVPKRLSFAQRLEAGFAAGGEFSEVWAAALPEIGATYPGLHVKPQMGLLPIGPDPASGLWEFVHLETGEPAVRGADGKLILGERTGLVFVLLPGGMFQMGAQRNDANGQNYDPQAQVDEAPVHAVTLSAFFLSKYEMTQGQWEWSSATNPSYYKPGNLVQSLIHAVEQVTWIDCTRELERLGLSLPSEAQWEYGARGGTSTAWWTGSERESLRGAANLADRAAAAVGAPWQDIKDWLELDDGYPVHSPVDAFLPNAFGLCNVHGNVWEWCLDAYESAFYARAMTKDPVSPPEGSSNRVNRGGSFNNAAQFTRSASRNGFSPSSAGFNVGLRPARALDP